MWVKVTCHLELLLILFVCCIFQIDFLYMDCPGTGDMTDLEKNSDINIYCSS